jgi:hypothetical protein
MRAVIRGSACLLVGLLAGQESAPPVAPGAEVASLPRLSKPVRIEADGAPITTATGHAAPFVVDFDKDGVRDLVVGQFADGVARVYRNVGTNSAPKFGGFTLLEADGAPASIEPG